MQFGEMTRRKLIALSSMAAVAWPEPASSQPSRKRVIGLLAAASPIAAKPQYEAVLDGMRELGYVEGRDYEIISKWAFGVMDRLPELAAELVRVNPDLIVAVPTPATVAIHKLTATIPIVSFMLADEVRLGLVASIARPGGNVTGLAMRLDGMIGKQIELATEAVSGLITIGILVNPLAADAENQVAEAKAVSASRKLLPIFVEARSPAEIEYAFQQLNERRVQGVVVLYDSLFYSERKRLAKLAIAGRLPLVCAARDHVIDGALLSYGISLRSSARRMTVYIDKILKGASPADLPIEFPTQLELTINLKTANAIGLTIPPTLLVRVHEAIE